MKAALAKDAANKVWKGALIRNYEAGNRDKALEIAYRERKAMLDAEGLDYVYNQLKSEAKSNAIVQVITWALFAALVFWAISCLT